MATKFLDQTGLSYLWSKIKTITTDKADTDLGNVTNDDFRDKAIDAGVGGLQTVTATSTDGVTYTATVAGVTALTTGLTITIIPDVVSTSISAKLNVNELGDKYIRQSTTNNSATGLTPKNANWMAANKPITIQYDGTQWKTVAARSNASDMNGILAIANGGTGGEKFIKDVSIDGKTITATYSDDTTETLTTQDTTYSNATTSAAGLMSASDKTKLNNLAVTTAGVYYATCSTDATTAAKVATVSSGTFTLKTGNIVVVKVSNGLSGNNFTSNASLTLNVNSTGAKALYPNSLSTHWGYNNGSTYNYYATSGIYVVCVYDGSAWRVVSYVYNHIGSIGT